MTKSPAPTHHFLHDSDFSFSFSSNITTSERCFFSPATEVTHSLGCPLPGILYCTSHKEVLPALIQLMINIYQANEKGHALSSIHTPGHNACPTINICWMNQWINRINQWWPGTCHSPLKKGLRLYMKDKSQRLGFWGLFDLWFNPLMMLKQ